jgi:hypothetical protein
MSKSFIVKSAIIGALLAAASVAVPAQAALTIVSACDKTLTNPDAVACAGYYSGNLLNGSAIDIANQQEAIASLPGDFVFDGNWAALDPEFKIESLSNINQMNFGKTLYGSTVIGAHFGNVAGDAGNVSVFWLFDFGSAGAQFVALDDTQGFSNAVLYTTGVGAVPEPSTWALMLLGFGAVGGAMRAKRRLPKTLSALA